MNSKNLEQMRGKRNICIYRLMPIIPTDSIDGLSFPRAAIGAFAAGPSETERQVIHLFDDFRDSLLRYYYRSVYPCRMERRSLRKYSWHSFGTSSWGNPAKTFAAGFFAWRTILL